MNFGDVIGGSSSTAPNTVGKTYAILLAGIVAIVFLIDFDPRIGWALLAVVVLGMLYSGRKAGTI